MQHTLILQVLHFKQIQLISKTEVGKLDIEKLAPVPVDLSKFSNVVKNKVVKKTVYDKLVPKVNNIDTSGLVLKTKFDSDKTKEKNSWYQ